MKVSYSSKVHKECRSKVHKEYSSKVSYSSKVHKECRSKVHKEYSSKVSPPSLSLLHILMHIYSTGMQVSALVFFLYKVTI
jgi:hypothetical protein